MKHTKASRADNKPKTKSGKRTRDDKKSNNNKKKSKIKCNFCQRFGHAEDECYKRFQNFVQNPNPKTKIKAPAKSTSWRHLNLLTSASTIDTTNLSLLTFQSTRITCHYDFDKFSQEMQTSHATNFSIFQSHLMLSCSMASTYPNILTKNTVHLWQEVRIYFRTQSALNLRVTNFGMQPVSSKLISIEIITSIFVL